VPHWQLEWAERIAVQLQIPHVVLATSETDRSDYQRNDSQRCFFCKQTLYDAIASFAAEQHGGAETVAIASGTNADDLGDYRPGIQAGRLRGVLTPLADLGFDKQRVRELAELFGLPNHDLPAAPCLASRIAYGTEVTPERLQRIERAESLLRQQGFREVRVRLHADELARIEVARREMPRLWELMAGQGLTNQMHALGFRFVTVDADGLQSGSMNRALVTIDAARPASRHAGNPEASVIAP
jgi:uncharacterized protein